MERKMERERKFATLCNLRQLITRNKCNTEKRQKMKYATYDIDVLMWARIIL